MSSLRLIDWRDHGHRRCPHEDQFPHMPTMFYRCFVTSGWYDQPLHFRANKQLGCQSWGCRWLTTIITIFSVPHIPKDRIPWFIKSCPNRCQSGEFAGGDATRIGLQDRAAMRRHGVTIGRPWRLPRKLVTWWQHFNVEPQSFWKMRWYCVFTHQYHSWLYIYIYLGTQTSIIV